MISENTLVGFVPERIGKSATFTLRGDIQTVFPLFGPIREMDWAFGWEPEMVYPRESLAEERMVFFTPGRHPSEPKYLWALTQLRSDIHLVEYTVSTQNRIWFIRVQCREEGNQTRVEVTYTFTGLNALGNELNQGALETMYAEDLSDWAEAINFYLDTGKQMVPTQ